jgi:hypothetical protein
MKHLKQNVLLNGVILPKFSHSAPPPEAFGRASLPAVLRQAIDVSVFHLLPRA